MAARSKITIHVTQNGQAAQTLAFEEFPVLFGRSPECHLKLRQSTFISRIHGSISLDGTHIVVSDLGSTNGLNYRGETVRAIRQEGNLNFKIGDLDFRIQLEGEENTDEDVTGISLVRRPRRTESSLTLPPAWSRMSAQAQASPSAPPSSPPPSIPTTPQEQSEVSHEASVHLAEGVQFSIAPFPQIEMVPRELLNLQGVITWDNDIYDVRNYRRGDPLIVGSSPTEPIYLPVAKGRVNLGKYTDMGVVVRIPPGTDWVLTRDKAEVGHEQLIKERKLSKESNGHILVSMSIKDVLSFDLGNGMALHFRYVRAPQFTLERTWIENREEFKKAVLGSGMIHLVIVLLAIFVAPRPQGPEIENVPPRIAKLLIEPPSQMLAPPPTPTPVPVVTPPPIETPAPTPKPVAIEKPPPPKTPPKKEKATVTKTQPKPNRPEPSQSIARNSKPDNEPPPPARAAPSQEQKQQEELANMLSALPAPPSGGSVNKGAPIQISKDRVSPAGVKVAGVTSALNSANQTNHGTAETGFKVGSAGATGYSTKGQAGSAGKRGVGGQVVGIPKLSASLGKEQGISNEEVMKVVNQHLGEVQRCYERALFEDGSIAGRVEYEWEISAQGSVTEAHVARSEVSRGDTLNNCVLGVFRKLKFPKASNGQTTVAKIGFPFGK